MFSLSLLRTRERNLRFLFLLSKLEKRISNFSFSSRNCRTTLNISLSLLENGEIVFTFSFSSQSLRIENPFLFLLPKVENIFLDFSFPLKTGEKNFRFLFLLSKLEKRISNFSFSSRFYNFASRHRLPYCWQHMLNCKINGTVHIFFLKNSYLSPR